MPFIGNQPALSYTSFAKQDFTTSATTSYTLDNPVANANELALFINFVRQEPTTAYTASGTTLTLTSATSATDDMYCVFLGKAVQTVNPPNGSVGTAQIANDAVTKDKLSAHNYPAFFASLSADQTGLTDNVYTKAQCDTEILDTDGYYDNSTNYRFTPLVAGKYYVYGQVTGDTDNTNLVAFDSALYKNGSLLQTNYSIFSTNYAASQSQSIQSIVDMNGTTDYLELFGRVNVLSGTTILFFGGNQMTSFGAFRIGD
jgi:hypothetical protein